MEFVTYQPFIINQSNSHYFSTLINKTTPTLMKSKSNVNDSCRPESIPVLKVEGSSINEECSNDENSNSHVVSNLSTINKHDHTLNRSKVTSHDYDGDVTLSDHNDDNASSSQHEAFTETRPTNMKKRLPSDHEESLMYSNIRKRNRTSIHNDVFPTYPQNLYHSECSLSSDQLDAQLAEELLGYTSPSPSDIGATPIPLLTPPASPIHIQSDESIGDICEWPSNLAVDNALTAVSKLRPLSLSSLALLVEGEERKEPFTIVFPRKKRLLSRK
jgi:hypothetical protein